MHIIRERRPLHTAGSELRHLAGAQTLAYALSANTALSTMPGARAAARFRFKPARNGSTHLHHTVPDSGVVYHIRRPSLEARTRTLDPVLLFRSSARTLRACAAPALAEARKIPPKIVGLGTAIGDKIIAVALRTTRDILAWELLRPW